MDFHCLRTKSQGLHLSLKLARQCKHWLVVVHQLAVDLKVQKAFFELAYVFVVEVDSDVIGVEADL